MSQPVLDELIEQFNKDRILLPYDNIVIAQRMGTGGPTYSSYINGRYPITHRFLKKFYAAFSDELDEIKNRLKPIAKSSSTLEELKNEIDKLKNLYETLESKYDSVILSHQQIAKEIRRVEGKVDKTIQQKLSNIESMLSSLVR